MRKPITPLRASGLLLFSLISGSLWAASPWQEGRQYQAGEEVSYQGQVYRARVAHEAISGANWNPQQAASLWLALKASPARATSTPAAPANNGAAAGSCTSVWSSSATYVGGNQVSYNGRLYQAKWWTRGEIPGTTGQWGVWQDLGVCAANPAATSTPGNTPTPVITSKPTATPTLAPTATPKPSSSPSTAPSASPKPSASPSTKPTATPTVAPTATPKPTAVPTVAPTATPKPTATPTVAPTATPKPTATPTAVPTAAPTASPTPAPSATPAPSSGLGLVINEIASDPYGSGSWLEIRNDSAASINLAELSLRTRNNSGTLTTFALGSGTLPAQGILVLAASTGAAGQVNTNQIRYLGSSSNYPRWSSAGGALELLRNGQIADFVRFGSNNDAASSANSWNGSNAPAISNQFGHALVRYFTQSKNTRSSADWTNVAFSTPAGRNDVPANANDDDGDGIPSSAKVAGGTYAGLDLYSMGARAGRRTILIQVDYMQSSDEGVKPQREALQAVVDAFARRNIDVLFDTGNLYAAGFSPVNFNLGGGKAVPFAACVDLSPPAGCSRLADYKADSMDLRRRQIFHYLLMASSRNADGSAGSSGVAEINGNDLVVSLGKWGLNSSTASNRYRLINFQAGTIMHELGHNLGLRHGGFENTNDKPNYYSIMNYLYQLQGLGQSATSAGALQRYYLKRGYYSLNSCSIEGGPCGNTFRIDYSDGSGERLNESALLESALIGRGSSAGLYADWNNSRTQDGASYALDLNADGSLGYLQDYDDWGNINLRFARTSSGNAGVAMLRSFSAVSEVPASKAFMHDEFEAAEEHAPDASFFAELQQASPYRP
ncbi:carbohydrate-binding protein [Chitinibacter tainanensis]|uniref:carbohydrate-binding protein n=1 Tax=Chitinibacter tainanensis TaxID=230667 RepID=UPI00041FF081|nr:carbohydrate-binding protein [Chitinibacter tainanensis]